MTASADPRSVFISSAPEDILHAKKLFVQLRHAGFTPWLEAESLLPGQRRDVEIRRAIRESRFFLVLLSSESVRRGNVNREVARALELTDEFPDSDIFIIPARLDDCTPSHEKIQELHIVNLFPDWDESVEKILRTIRVSVDAEEPSVSPPDAERTTSLPPPGDENQGESKAEDTKIEKPPSSLPAFAVLLILIVAMMVTGFLAKDALSTLLGRYAHDFSIATVYAIFVGLSLIAAVVLFGIMRSSGVFRKTGKQGTWEFGGAMAGFLVLLMFLITSYSTQTTAPPAALEINGNVRFVENGQPVGPVVGATVALTRHSGHEIDTDKHGNFSLYPPNDQQIQEIELQVTYQSKTYYRTVQRSDMDRIVVEIPKADGADDADVRKTPGTGDRIQSPDIAPGGDIKGDVNITYGDGEKKNDQP